MKLTMSLKEIILGRRVLAMMVESTESLSADSPPFHPLHEKYEAIKIDKKASKIGKDLWKQLKRVSIPISYGDKKMHENWKAAFAASTDQAPATEEYKLLQLHHYLYGEALKAIEGLGHSAFAYQAAKERLERKYWWNQKESYGISRCI